MSAAKERRLRTRAWSTLFSPTTRHCSGATHPSDGAEVHRRIFILFVVIGAAIDGRTSFVCLGAWLQGAKVHAQVRVMIAIVVVVSVAVVVVVAAATVVMGFFERGPCPCTVSSTVGRECV